MDLCCEMTKGQSLVIALLTMDGAFERRNRGWLVGPGQLNMGHDYHEIVV